MDVPAVADYLGISARSVYRLVAQRRIPYLRWGGLRRFDSETLGEWLAGKSVSPYVGRGRPGQR